MPPYSERVKYLPGILAIYGPPAGNPILPLVLDSPHSGRHYPEDFGHAAPLSLLRRAEDAFVDDLFEDAPAVGAYFVKALFARSYIDPNRHEDEIDPTMLAEPWPRPLLTSEKTEMGLGLIRRLIKGNVDIYDRPLSIEEIERRITLCHRPYMEELTALIEGAHRAHGQAWHLNCHSMRSAGKKGGRPVPRADFVLGDREGVSCDAEFTDLVSATLRKFGYRVAINDPFKGAELVSRFGQPAQSRHSLQLEVNRALYMDEDKIEKTDDFHRLKADLNRLLAMIAAFIAERTGATSQTVRAESVLPDCAPDRTAE